MYLYDGPLQRQIHISSNIWFITISICICISFYIFIYIHIYIDICLFWKMCRFFGGTIHIHKHICVYNIYIYISNIYICMYCIYTYICIFVVMLPEAPADSFFGDL